LSINTDSDPTTRAAEAAERIADLTSEFLIAADGLAWIADELVTADNLRRAALAQAGQHDRRPPIGERLTEVLHGRLSALRPHVPFVTNESADRAAEALTGSD
jgi:hypothetical protein